VGGTAAFGVAKVVALVASGLFEHVDADVDVPLNDDGSERRAAGETGGCRWLGLFLTGEFGRLVGRD
jgi:hypothetical protein